MMYTQGEVTKMPILSQEEVLDFIVEKKESGMNFEQIADALAKKGHKSPKTGKPLVAQSVRYIYFYGPKKRALEAEEKPSGSTRKIVGASTAEAKLDLIRNLLDMKVADKVKLDMIRAAIQDLR